MVRKPVCELWDLEELRVGEEGGVESVVVAGFGGVGEGEDAAAEVGEDVGEGGGGGVDEEGAGGGEVRFPVAAIVEEGLEVVAPGGEGWDGGGEGLAAYVEGDWLGGGDGVVLAVAGERTGDGDGDVHGVGVRGWVGCDLGFVVEKELNVSKGCDFSGENRSSLKEMCL